MAENSKIEWTDATWNPITGCTLVDEGCRHCYAAHLITSWPAIGNHPSRKGLARKNAAGVAFYFKQWGEFGSAAGHPGHLKIDHVFDDGFQMIRFGKKRAGRMLDGVEWSQFPDSPTSAHEASK